MAGTKQTAKKSTGGKAPRKQLAPKATRKLLATRKPAALPDLQNLQELNEAYDEGKEIEKRMKVFAAKPYRRLRLVEKVVEMEDQVEAHEAELKRMKSALETARSELEKEEAAERQDEEDAVRLEVVRATIEKAVKGLGKELETKIGKSSESEGESDGGAEECDDCACGSMAGSVDPDRGELSSTDDLGGQTDFGEARMSVPPENELSVVQDKTEEETEN